jgi:hypothetical protein
MEVKSLFRKKWSTKNEKDHFFWKKNEKACQSGKNKNSSKGVPKKVFFGKKWST